MNELDTTQLRAWADKDERYGFTDSAAERRAAADTIDALRRILAEAPHEPGCPLYGPQTWQSAWADCSCWKSRIEETR